MGFIICTRLLHGINRKSNWQNSGSLKSFRNNLEMLCPPIPPGYLSIQEGFTWLRWDWVFVERTQILSGIQFTTHFIESFNVQTKRFVGTSLNVILTRQTCGQRSGRAAESKRRALGNLLVAKGIVEPKHQKRWPQNCRVLHRSLFTTRFVEFSGISVVIKC